MAKELYIIRHGKSDWHQDWNDIDRPLKTRGLRDAYRMAKSLAEENLKPDWIISSTANRAMHTASIFARTLIFDLEKTEVNHKLYLAEAEEISEIVSNSDNNVNTLLIFGHNPGFTEYANWFLDESIMNLPTTGIVHLKFNCENWNEISAQNKSFEKFSYPKESI